MEWFSRIWRTMAKTLLGELNKAIAGLVTFLPDDDILCLSEYASKVPDNGNIVDIGTADGASAVIMAVSSPDSVKILTIDPVESQHFKDRLKLLNLENRVTFMHGKSEDTINRWNGEAIDLLFIDGMHEYGAVRSDIALWGAFVKDKGYILIHDTLYYDNTVGAAAREAVTNGLLKQVKLIETDIDNKFGRKVGMLITQKLPWNK